ncbi:metallophosphoesterase [Prevotella sp. 10(H)]|uniref:metallophosphoesterase n=1 Tax=Prevotella sp. 10(H) TaxID=1158294 RepID=UPI0004A6FE32|nr:metallophosphoesterase [Prevotella sp. 10(H)]
MLGRIFTYCFVALLLADIYIFILYIRKLTKNMLLRILWFIPSVVLLAGMYYFFFSSGRGSSHREVFSMVFMALSLPKIIFFVISLLDLPLRYFFKWKVYPFTVVGVLASLGVLYIVIYGSTAGQTRFEVREVEYSSPDLPASFDGYRIVQISDLHTGKWKGDTKPLAKVVSLVNAQKPDAVMVTGDLVHNVATELNGFDKVLSGIKAPGGVYSVLGNHDYGLYRGWKTKDDQKKNLQDLKRRQASFGWKLLNNHHTYLTKGEDKIALIGVENDGAPPFPRYGNLKKAMQGTTKQDFKILLSHDPTHWRREVLKTDVDLMLAGHTHATQFALFGLSPASFVYKEWWGMYKEGKQALYVNGGIGTAILSFRYGAWPEITVITLRKK